MTRTFRHVVLPGLAPAAFFLVAFTPVEVLGCFNRGLMALAIAMTSVIGGLVIAVKGGPWAGGGAIPMHTGGCSAR
jgi:hypothetical protein